ncbi:quinoprotein dehydrogenase-associated putative ABC transporter substrate-binding protein [Aquabacterium sp.]|uniref:quinoprotein dehydrogenase-associated putative ABC transporter substrate-binding protein n=1 Tax=Aquabacterium sp. TaxID=1872578 RepID=UPI003D6D1652
MCSRFLDGPFSLQRWRGVIASAWFAFGWMTAQAQATPTPLRVCADPDNPPFSQRDESGFENELARLMAEDLKRPLQYTWLRDRRGFLRKTLHAGRCDLVIGVPVDLKSVWTTMPYYRSGFYFVGRATDAALDSFTDPRLATMKVGVQLIGIDPGTSPVGYALARHGATQGIVGYTLAEDDRPPAQRMVEAVAAGRLDRALVWGPQAGHFARQSPVPLRLSLARAPADMAGIPFAFLVGMGTRRDDHALHATAESFLTRRRADIDRILAAHGVLRTDAAEARP